MAMTDWPLERVTQLETRQSQTATEVGVLRRDMAEHIDSINDRLFWLTVGMLIIGTAAFVLSVIAIVLVLVLL